MGYVDDWASTSEDDQARLKAVCADERCGHLRYQHGSVTTVRRGYYRFVEMTELGKCTNCKCKVFWEESPITEDDVMDVEVALRGDVHLEDIGIKVWTNERCTQQTIRHTGAGQLIARCKLEKNHPEAEHDPDWNDLQSAEGK